MSQKAERSNRWRLVPGNDDDWKHNQAIRLSLLNAISDYCKTNRQWTHVVVCVQTWIWNISCLSTRSPLSQPVTVVKYSPPNFYFIPFFYKFHVFTQFADWRSYPLTSLPIYCLMYQKEVNTFFRCIVTSRPARGKRCTAWGRQYPSNTGTLWLTPSPESITTPTKTTQKEQSFWSKKENVQLFKHAQMRKMKSRIIH